MSNPTRDRIAATFEREVEASPLPAGLRSRAVHAAVAAPRQQQGRPPRFLALLAAVLAIAIIATLVIGSHAFRSSVPARPSSSSPPAPRSDASLVFDQAHGDLVLFGGQAGDGGTGVAQASDNDTWTWDGKSWTLHHSASAPPARISAVMAYDAAQHDVVLFGGTPLQATSAQGGPAYLSDTWTWNGSTWKEQHPAHQPTFDFSWPATMAFDPVSRTVLLFGFRNSSSGNQGNMQSETWSWGGADWAQLSPSSGPQGTGTMVGRGTSLLLIAGQIWRWDGSNWIGAGPLHNDATGLGLAAAYDTQRGQIVSLDGGDTWTWDGSAWTRQHPRAQPQTAGYMAYFEPLHEVISWGDLWGNTNNDLWAWDGSTWNLVQRGTVAYASPPGQFGPDAPAAAGSYIRQNVTNTSPVLLPTWLPVTMEATVDLTADVFNVQYRSDQRDKTIGFGIVVANPPPGGPRSSDRHVKFRNSVALKYGPAGYGDYFVYDPSSPTSARWLMWIEPGTMSNPQLAGPGVPYFLSATGLTDAEFWRVANSLK